MRRIISFNRVSADGYFSDAKGGLGWAVPEDELDKAAATSLGKTGAMIFGRRTYDNFESFWPNVAKQARQEGTAPDPHAAGRASAHLSRIAVWIDEAEKIVFSRTRKDVPWNNSRVISEFDAHQVQELKQGSGADIMLFGSGTITSLLTEHRLVDEYQLIVNPVFLGDGKLLIHGVPQLTSLKLLDSRAYPSGNVMLRYGLAEASSR